MNEQEIRDFCEAQYNINANLIRFNDTVIDKFNSASECIDKLFEIAKSQHNCIELLNMKINILNSKLEELKNSN